MFNELKLQHVVIAAVAAIGLVGCEANGGGAGAGGSGGQSSVISDDGTDENGNVVIEGTESNSNTGFPNKPLTPGGAEVGGVIQATDADGNTTDVAYGDSGKRFYCSTTYRGGVNDTDAAASGLVGGILGPILGGLGGGPVNALTNSVKDQVLAIDGDLKSASVFTLTADALGALGADVVDGLSQSIYLNSPSTGYAVFAVSFPKGTVDLGLLTSVTVTTYLDPSRDALATEPTEPAVTFNATAIDLLGQGVTGVPYAFIGRDVRLPYNRAEIKMKGDLLAANVGEAMYVHELCTAGSIVDVPAATPAP